MKVNQTVNVETTWVMQRSRTECSIIPCMFRAFSFQTHYNELTEMNYLHMFWHSFWGMYHVIG